MANKSVIITIINKAYVEPNEDEYPTMLDLFLEGFWAGENTRALIDHVLVVSMDETAHEMCKFRRLNCYSLAAHDVAVAGAGNRFSRETIYMSDEFVEMMWRRTLFLLNVLKRGYNFIFTVSFLNSINFILICIRLHLCVLLCFVNFCAVLKVKSTKC